MLIRTSKDKQSSLAMMRTTCKRTISRQSQDDECKFISLLRYWWSVYQRTSEEHPPLACQCKPGMRIPSSPFGLSPPAQVHIEQGYLYQQQSSDVDRAIDVTFELFFIDILQYNLAIISSKAMTDGRLCDWHSAS